jgi:hypothetical protein
MKMASNIRKLGILVILTTVLLLGVLVLAASYSGIGATFRAGNGGHPSSVYDLSAVPPSVTEDATELATTLFGDSQDKCDDFVNQILVVYSEAKDKDFVIFSNAGGWGWNLVETSPGWRSILNGIKSELGSSGYTSLVLDHLRTDESLTGLFKESTEMITRYPSKAKDLASRVEFLTRHIPDLTVILAGESTGTVINDSAMTILEDNPQVYSIQTGPPFWHEPVVLERTLVLAGNGIDPDSLNQGNYFAIAWGYFKIWTNLSEMQNEFGTVPHRVAAPGHDYWWQYPRVYSQITNFLEQNFGLKW